MLKVQWDTAVDPHKHCFAICNSESAFELWFMLTHIAVAGVAQAINVRVFDLAGNEQDPSKGWDRVHGEYTHT